MPAIIRIALAQVAPCEDREENLSAALGMVRDAAEAGARLVCFPEMSFDPFFPARPHRPEFFALAETVPGPVTARLSHAAREHEVVIVPNLYERAGPGRYYDCSPVIDADGRLLGKSRMIHIAEEPGFNERFYYWEGDTGFPVYDTAAGRVGIAICYDRHYPEHTRALAVGGAELILVPTACAADEDFPMYEVELQACSFQNQVFAAFVNRAGARDGVTWGGRSFVTGPAGRVRARAGPDKPELLLCDLDFTEIELVRRGRYYLRDRRPEVYGAALGRRQGEPD